MRLRRIVLAILILWALLAGLGLTWTYADSVNLQSVDLQYQHYVGTVRDPLYPDTTPNEGWRLGANVDVLNVAGVEAQIIAGTDEGAFHYGGLHYYAFIRVVPQVQIGWSHQSLHLFDGPTLPNGFPLYNAVEVRVKLYDNGPKPGSLF